MNDVSADVFSGSISHHFAATTGEQQALHVDVVDTVQLNFSRRQVHAVVGVPAPFHHQFGSRMDIQANACGRINAALHIDQAAGIEVTAGFDRLARLVQGGAADKGTLIRLNENVRVAARPHHILGQHIALGVKCLAQFAARIDPSHQFNAPCAFDRDRAAGAGSAQTRGRDAARGIHQHRQAVTASAHLRAIPAVIQSWRAACDGHIATGQQAGLQTHLLAGFHSDVRAAIAVGIQRKCHALAADRPTGHNRAEEVDIFCATNGHPAA